MRAWLGIVAFALAAAVKPSPAAAEQRLALIVGVSDYGGRALPNVANANRDAVLVEAGLKDAGFTTAILADPDMNALQAAVRKLAADASHQGEGATIAFYFAGHGFQSEGRNFLVPAGVAPAVGRRDEEALRRASLPVQWVLDQLGRSGARHLLMVIDACRTSPFGGTARDGLAPMVRPSVDVKIVFAAEPGAPAFEGPSGENSYFSRALADTLRIPGLTVDEIFYSVGRRVDTETGHRQQPYVQGFLPYSLKQAPAQPARVSKLGIEPARIGGPEDGIALLQEILKTQSLTSIEEAANTGDGFAMYLMGLARWEGMGGASKSRTDARLWMKKAIAKEVGRAATALGYLACCDTDRPDWSEAIEWYRIGEGLGSAGSIRNLASAYRDGNGIEKDWKEAERLYMRAGELGLAVGFDLAAWLHRDRQQGEFDIARAIQLHKRALDAGYLEAAPNLATIYEFGLWGIPRDLELARHYLGDAGERGCATCWASLASSYSLETSPEAAEQEVIAYRRGAEAGDGQAMMELARHLISGRGTAVDKVAAFSWLERAMAAGNLEAVGGLGIRLARGEGHAADPEKAALLLQQALKFQEDPKKRFQIYEPIYWGFAFDLARLHEQGLIANSSKAEAARLHARYGSRSGKITRMSILIDCEGTVYPFDVYLLDWEREEPPTAAQAEWLWDQRGCRIPDALLRRFANAYDIYRKTGVYFTILARLFVGTRIGGTGEESPASLMLDNLEPLGTKVAVLVKQGDRASGGRFTYLELTLLSLYSLREEIASGRSFDPSKFGTVIDSGAGEPSLELRQRIASTYKLVEIPAR